MTRANDGHVHLTSREAGSGRSAADLVAAMDAAGVDRAAVVTPSTLGWDNAITFEAVADHPGRFVGIARIDLRAGDGLETLADVLARGAVGIRITTFGEADLGWLLEPRMDEVATRLAERATVAEFHCEPEQLDAVGGFAARHPAVPVLIDHLGRPEPGSAGTPHHLAFLALADLGNVFAKTPNFSFFSKVEHPHADLTSFIDSALDRFGADRLLWSADWPLCLDGGPYRLALDAMIAALEHRSADERAAVLAGTFDRLFGR